MVTDYPDAALIDNLGYNVKQNLPKQLKEVVEVKVCVSISSTWQRNMYSFLEIGVYMGSERSPAARIQDIVNGLRLDHHV